MSDVPSLRVNPKQWCQSKGDPLNQDAALPEVPMPSRTASLWKWLLGGALILGVTGLMCTPVAPTAAPAPKPGPTAKAPSVQVPRLALAPDADDEPAMIARVHAEPTEQHKGCYVMAGVAVPLSAPRVVARPRGAYLTAQVPLVCTTGEDLKLDMLLDCPESGRCQVAGFFSQATRSYYRVTAKDLELHYKNGSPQDSYPTHLLVLRPTRLKTFSSSWGIE